MKMECVNTSLFREKCWRKKDINLLYKYLLIEEESAHDVIFMLQRSYVTTNNVKVTS